MCWQLERTQVRKNRIVWQPYKYFSTFEQALTAAGERKIRTAPVHTLTAAITAVHQIADKYSQIIDGAISDQAKRAPLRLVS